MAETVETETIVSQLALYAQSIAKDNIRAEGDFHKEICIAERTNKAEIKRPEEHSEKAESCRENLWNVKQFKGPYRQIWTQARNKKVWESSADLCNSK